MIIEKLEPYTARKELSKKAKKEIVEIMRCPGDADEKDWDDAVECLLKFPSDVTYDFISECYEALDEPRKDALYRKLLSACSVPEKGKTVLYAAIALNKAGSRDEAEKLLGETAFRSDKKGKINDRLVNFFIAAAGTDGGGFLFERHSGWKEGDMNSYRKVLLAYAKCGKDGSAVSNARKWYKNNGVQMDADERRVMACTDDGKDSSVAEGTESKRNVPEKNPDGASKPGSTVGSEDAGSSEKKNSDDGALRVYSVEKLLDEIKGRLLRAESEKTELRKRLETADYRAGEQAKKSAVLSAELEASKKELGEKVQSYENAVFELKGCNAKLRDENSRLSAELASLMEKYESITSAYDQSGKTEIEAFKSEIGASLSNDFKKYGEIKSLDRDIGYYDALIGILDKVFKVLKRNGVDF